MKEKFLQFNIGHLLTIITLVGSAVGVWVSIQRADASQEVRLAGHETALATHTRIIAEHDASLRRIGIMANDIAWIKEEMQRRRND